MLAENTDSEADDHPVPPVNLQVVLIRTYLLRTILKEGEQIRRH